MNLKTQTAAPAASTKRHHLFINRDFALLWIGQSVSEFGSWITSNALGLTAILALNAVPLQMGLLATVGTIPVLLIGLLAGVWVDRLHRRPILILADLGRALLLLSIPIAAILGWLRIEQLYIVTFLVGTLTVFFDVAYRSFLPAIVPRESLIEGNSKLSASSSLAEIAGPSLSGLLIQTLTAPIAILLDCLSFLFSALSLALIRVQEATPTPTEERQSALSEIRAGLHLTFSNPILHAIAACSATRTFFGGAFYTLYALYVIRTLGITPVVYGLLVTMGGVGAFLGALVATRVVRRFGVGKALIGGMLLHSFTALLIPLSSVPLIVAITLLALSQLVGDCGDAIHSINEMSLRQHIVPDRYIGRVNASINFLVSGVGPIGALLAGLLSEIIGIRFTLLIAVGGMLCSSLWLFFSPIRKLQ